jgi:hypothetical protein
MEFGYKVCRHVNRVGESFLRQVIHKEELEPISYSSELFSSALMSVVGSRHTL